MAANIFIPTPNHHSIGGSSTFMRNLYAYLKATDYPIQNEMYHSTAIFFPVQFDQKALLYYQKIGGAVIQRLDGVYYPSQHGEAYSNLNSKIVEIYNNYATHVVFQSNYSRTQCFEMMGGKNQKEYTIIYNGVNTSIFYPDPAHKFAQDGMIRFITVGNFRKKAMIVPIVKALDVLSEKYPLQLTMVGNVTESELRQYLDREYIRHEGPKNAQDVAQLLRTSDIFLHSQLNDNCPNAVMEAISTGLPVVGFNSGSMPELCGFSSDLLADIPYKIFHTYEDFKWELLMNSIDFCITHYDLKRKIALEHVGLYDFKSCGQQYIGVFNQELSQVGRTRPPLNYLIKGFIKQGSKKLKHNLFT